MSTATTTTTSNADRQKHRLTTAEFDAMLADGTLVEGSKTYLWNGEIIEPMAENQPHANAQDNLQDLLKGLLPSAEWTISPAHPIALKDGYKPQPDLMVLVGPRSHYRRRVPVPADGTLVIEVADSSYPTDAGDKLRQYAAAGIPRYWIVHLQARRIEAYSGPVVSSGVGRYADRKDYSLGEAVPLILTRGGVNHEFGLIPVLDVLRDSLEGE